MRRKNLKRLLDRAWPSPKEQETEASGARVWNRLKEELKTRDMSLRSLYGDGWNAAPLNDREFQVLTAASASDTQGTIREITKSIQKWTESIQDVDVTVLLLQLEKRGLIKSRKQPPAREGGEARFHWELTGDGDRALRRAKIEQKQLAARMAEFGYGCTESE